MNTIFWLIPVTSVFALIMARVFFLTSVFALIMARVFFLSMIKESEGTDRMKEIAQYVREGAMALKNLKEQIE